MRTTKKLLIITQIVNEQSRLGFFIKWIEEFSKKYDSIEVICLEKGKYSFPKNVRVHSLGKEQGISKFQQVKRFFKLIHNLSYDHIFVHMNPIWIVLSGLYWKLKHKPIHLWYTHRYASLNLRIAKFFSRKIFTASKESFSLYDSHKVVIVGHGIPETLFKPKKMKRTLILHVGRISPIKRIELILEAIPKKLTIIGEAVNQETYMKKISSHKNAECIGLVEQKNLPHYYQSSLYTINACKTGGMDKTVLESLMSGTIAFYANSTFDSLYGSLAKKYKFSSVEDLKDKIQNYSNEDALHIRKRIIKHYSLSALIQRLYNEMNT